MVNATSNRNPGPEELPLVIVIIPQLMDPFKISSRPSLQKNNLAPSRRLSNFSEDPARPQSETRFNHGLRT